MGVIAVVAGGLHTIIYYEHRDSFFYVADMSI